MPEELNKLLNDWSWLERSIVAMDLAPVFRFQLAASAPGAPDWRPTPAEIVGHEAEAAKRHGPVARVENGPPIAGQLLYPLALSFESADVGVAVPFPWETLQDMAGLFGWLRTAESGSDWLDVDQGWLVKAAWRGDRLHFLHSGFDQGDEMANVSVDRVQFLQRLNVTENDAGRTLARLEAEFARGR